MLLALLIAAATTAVSGSACNSAADCSMLGVCTAGLCVCDAGWGGPACGVLQLLPVRRGTGFNRTAEAPQPTSTWGANIFPGAAAGRWDMIAAEFEQHCDISHWSPNSAIVHAVSTAGPEGPYTRQSVAVPPFAHNPKVLRAPDGTWLMYTIGVRVPELPYAPKIFNCTKPVAEREAMRQLAGEATANSGHKGVPPVAPPPGSPGRTPPNLESNVTLYTAPEIKGPWTRFGIVLGRDFLGTWDEDTSNPSPYILPNGTVLLMYRGCKVSGGGCDDEKIGIARADHWKGPYQRLLGSILPDLSAEDPVWPNRHTCTVPIECESADIIVSCRASGWTRGVARTS